MGWPQYTYLALMLLGLGISFAKHGEPQSRHNAITHSIAVVLILFLLNAGGFFG